MHDIKWRENEWEELTGDFPSPSVVAKWKDLSSVTVSL